MPSVSLHIKLAAAAAAALSVSLIQSYAAVLIVLTAGAAAAAVFGVFSERPSLRRLASVQPLLLLLWATVPFSMPGKPLFFLFGAPASMEGCRIALSACLKCESTLLVISAMTAGSDAGAMGAAMHRLGIPSRFVFLFVFMCRYADAAVREWKRLFEAAELRGFRPRTSLHTYSTLAYMLALTFIYGGDRAKRVWEAMQLRGFRGVFRTLNGQDSERHDLTFCILCAAVLAAVVLCEIVTGEWIV